MPINNLTTYPPLLTRINILKYVLPVLLVFLPAACTQDEDAAPDTALPEGEYPLLIAGVSLTVEADEQPWTRVAESTDGSASQWQEGDILSVKFNDYDEVGTYRIADVATGTVEPLEPLYWHSATQSGALTAWHASPANDDGTVDLSNQSQGLAYVLQATTTATLGQAVSLTFKHRLAKVRVTLDGTQAKNVTGVEVNNYTRCTHTRGGNVQGGTAGWIAMHPVGSNVYEANVVPGVTIDPANFIRLNSNVPVTLNGSFTLSEGRMYALNITVNPSVPEGAQEIPAGGIISDDGTYVVRGNRGEPITITGGEPHIYLSNATVSVTDGNGISVTGGSPTIHVVGSNSVTSGNGAGIYVASTGSVTIAGCDRKDVLTAGAGGDGTGGDGAGIGSTGYIGTSASCGDITIRDVTVYARSAASFDCSPGIGAYDDCGAITITNATVYAYGTAQGASFAPAIGSASGSLPAITISGSDIHAYRGAYNTSTADWIGQGHSPSETGGNILGTITTTTVYKNTYDCDSFPFEEIVTGDSRRFD